MIYIYDADATDLTGIGLVGALMPSSCLFEEIGNGLSEITMDHPVDTWNKYQALKIDRILSVDVPVRTVPEIENGQYVTSVETWTVVNTATKDERAIWSSKKNGYKRYTCKAGSKITVVSIPADDSIKRYKVIFGKYSGWMESSALHYESTTVIPATSDGIETVAPSYTVKPQYFRISSVEINDKGVVHVVARHITYDLMYNISTWQNTKSYTLQSALDNIMSHCITPHQFTATTNIQGTHVGALYADYDPITAMLDPDEGLCRKWSAEIVRDNNDIVLLDEAGLDRGVRIEYGKNLVGVTMTTNMENVCTRIRPIGEDKNGNKLYLTTNDGCVDSTKRSNYAFDRVMTLTVDDATEADDVSIALCRRRMTEAAEAQFSKGIDMPAITLSVEFAQLGDDARYAQYKDLEKIFLYDTVHVYHKALGIDTKIKVIRINYDCLRHRMVAIELGKLLDMVSTVSGFQISGGVSGDKLIYGSVGGSQLGDNAVSSKHISADSIYTEALQAGSIVADKVASGAITTDKLDANAVTADKILAGTITSDKLNTESFNAAVGNIVTATIGTADIGYAQIKDASVQTLFTYDGNADEYYINKLRVTSAQVLQLMVGTLVFKGTDGSYYTMDAITDASGNVTMSPRVYSGTIDENGLTNDGRYVFEEEINVADLTAANAHIADAIITRLQADKFFANEAFVNRLTTSQIFADGGTLDIVADSAAYAQDAVGDINSTLSDYQLWYHFDEDGLRIQKLNPDGTAVSTYSTLTDNYGFHVQQDGVKIASMQKRQVVAESYRVSKVSETGNRVVMRESSDGGIIFVSEAL